VQFIYNIKVYISSTIHTQYKNIQLISAITNKHSYDSSYSSPMYYTSTEI